MYKILFFIAFILFIPNSYSAVYKQVDEQGNVIYSDKPGEKGKKIEPPASTTYTPPPTTRPASTPSALEQSIESAAYSNIAISEPANDVSIRDNAGNVSVKVIVTPALKLNAGHKIALYLDGKLAAKLKNNSYTFENLDRGAHTLKAAVISSTGKILKESGEVTFYLHRFSVLHKK
jgi:hypothetical protein